MLRAVGFRPAPGSLRDVSQDGFGRTDKLVSALGMALRQVANDVANKREKFDGTLADRRRGVGSSACDPFGRSPLKLSTKGPDLSSTWVVQVHVVVAVNDNVNVNEV